MTNLKRYIHGALIGMIGEYLLRVEFNIIPLLILLLLLSFVVIDIVNTNCHKNKKD